MGKGVAAGILIALIAGAGIGYFLLPMVFPSQAADDRQTTFIDDANIYFPTALLTDIPGLVINLTTQAGDSLELAFTSYFRWETNISGLHPMQHFASQ